METIEKAKLAQEKIITDLCGRAGGDHFFEPIDEETQDEIRGTWTTIIYEIFKD